MNTDYTEQIESTEDGYVYERIRLGDFEREIRGPAEYVERRMNETFDYITRQRLALQVIKSGEQEQPILLESDTSPLAGDDVSSNEETSSVSQSSDAPDLCSFYLEKSPNSKGDALKVITFYYHKFRQHQTVTYDDFDQAYRELAAIGVDEPGNIRTSVRTAINNKHLHRVDKVDGHFALTYQGKEYVKSMEKA